jgi:hypothetical protein
MTTSSNTRCNGLRRTIAPVLVSLTLALSGCGAMLAQNPSGSYSISNS